MPSRSYRADLAAIPTDYRDPIQHYFETGALPENRLLVAILKGDYRYAVIEIDRDLTAVIHFLERHCPDFAYGTPEQVAKWQVMQGMLRGNGADVT